jgi:broad specificity phosphatase PhoE
MLTIYLLRHGETKWTILGKHTGLTDIPLTQEGEKQVSNLYEVIKNIPFEKVFCSPLVRAKKTCEICHLLEGAIITNDLLEWNYGDYEGLTSQDIHKTDPNWTVFSKDPKGGETKASIAKRADHLIEEFLKLDGNVALFSSGHFLRAFTARWLKFPVSFGEHLLLSTASVSVLSFEHNNRIIKSWNLNFS